MVSMTTLLSSWLVSAAGAAAAAAGAGTAGGTAAAAAAVVDDDVLPGDAGDAPGAAPQLLQGLVPLLSKLDLLPGEAMPCLIAR
jgi:hypothetical protein